jgi:hypothetical protein
MTAEIASVLSLERLNEDDSVAIVAGELVAQHGADAVDLVAEWGANLCAAYTTPFWRKVIDELRRTARCDRR